jgi:hypothetical protein
MKEARRFTVRVWSNSERGMSLVFSLVSGICCWMDGVDHGCVRDINDSLPIACIGDQNINMCLMLFPDLPKQVLDFLGGCEVDFVDCDSPAGLCWF